MVGYRYTHAPGVPGPNVQKRELLAAGVKDYKVVPIPTDKYPSRERRDFLLFSGYALRPGDYITVADAAVLADGREDARKVLKQLMKLGAGIHICGEDPASIQTKEDINDWVDRCVPSKSARMRNTGGPVGRKPKWSPTDEQRAAVARKYHDVRFTMAEVLSEVAKQGGAGAGVDRVNLWGMFGQRKK